MLLFLFLFVCGMFFECCFFLSFFQGKEGGEGVWEVDGCWCLQNGGCIDIW